MKTNISPPELDRALRVIARSKKATPDARANATALLIGDVERRYKGGVKAVAKGLLASIAAGSGGEPARVLRKFTAGEVVRSNPKRKKYTPILIPGAPELRMVRVTPGSRAAPVMRSSNDIAMEFAFVSELHIEEFWIMFLDGRHRMTGRYMISRGGTSSSAVYVSEVMRAVLFSGTDTFIAVHCHPAGMPTPSDDDIAITRRMTEASQIVGLRFLDHIIIADSSGLTPPRGIGYGTIHAARPGTDAPAQISYFSMASSGTGLM